MEFAYVFIEEWIIDPYVQCFFDSSAEVLLLPPYNIEIFNGDLMTSDVAMVINWCYSVTKFAGTTFSSVLKMLTAVSESLAYLKNIISAKEKII